MKILAVDSTAKVASVALCDDCKLLAEYTLNNGNTHSETLLPMVKAILDAFGMKPHDIDLYAASVGPGSFTGVRIGTSTIKGLAFGTDTPVVGVSTLEALAMNLNFDDGENEKYIIPCMDARREQLYTAMFVLRDHKLCRLTPDRAISCEELANDVASLGHRVWICGDGYDIAAAHIPNDQMYDTPIRLRYQSAYSVCTAALAAYDRGEFASAEALAPTYLRLSQAERERAERLAAEKQHS